MSLPKITESTIRAGASAQSFQRGKEYYAGGAIANARVQGRVQTGECEGTSAPYYGVRVELDAGGIRSASCTCPYEFGGYCKHVVALPLTYLQHLERFTVRPDPADLDRAGLARVAGGVLRATVAGGQSDAEAVGRRGVGQAPGPGHETAQAIAR